MQLPLLPDWREMTRIGTPHQGECSTLVEPLGTVVNTSVIGTARESVRVQYGS